MIVNWLVTAEITGSYGGQLIVGILIFAVSLLISSCLGVIFLPRLIAAQKIKDLKDDLDLVRQAKKDYVDAVASITLAKSDLERKYTEITDKYTRNLEVMNTVVDENVELRADVKWLIDQFKAATGKHPPLRLKIAGSRP